MCLLSTIKTHWKAKRRDGVRWAYSKAHGVAPPTESAASLGDLDNHQPNRSRTQPGNQVNSSELQGNPPPYDEHDNPPLYDERDERRRKVMLPTLRLTQTRLEVPQRRSSRPAKSGNMPPASAPAATPQTRSQGRTFKPRSQRRTYMPRPQGATSDFIQCTRAGPGSGYDISRQSLYCESCSRYWIHCWLDNAQCP